MHPSIIKTGSQLESIPYQSSQLGCPLCPKFITTRGKTIWRHLDAHIKKAVHFQDTIICRCNLSCRYTGHYHCPYCAKTIMRREVMTLHVTGCQKRSDMVPGPCEPSSLVLPPSVPPSAELSPSVPSSTSLCASQEIPAHPQTLPKPHSAPCPPLSALEDSIASVVGVDHSYTLPPSASVVGVDPSDTVCPSASLQSSAVTAQSCQPPSASPSASPPEPSKSHAFPPEEAASAAAQSETMDLLSSRVTFLKSVKCPHCSVVLYKKNLLVHIQRKHARPKDITAASYLKSVCVDETRGLFAIPKGTRGFCVPIHVQRKTWGKQHVTKCELEDCRQYQFLAQRSGLSHSLCEHIRSLDYCTKTATEEPLKHEVLEEMPEWKFFGESKVAACKKRQKAAEKAHAPLSVLVEVGGSQNQICLSVHEPKIYHSCCFGRVMVTYNRKKNTWHCPCAKVRTSCPHKNIAKWHLFQTRKELFMTAPSTTETLAEMSHSVSSPPPTEIEMERSVRYLYEEKKIPATLPGDATTPRAQTDYPSKLIPAETTCKRCVGNPRLEEMSHITDKARIVGMNGIIQNISTYSRRCTDCHMMYRYQEWTDGLHNFNDRVVLTLQLCLYLRHNLQNHVSVSRVISSLETLWKERFPDTHFIFQAYCHFEALCNIEYTYSCVNCGFYPPVVLMDLHRKGVFEVSELKQASEDFQGEHNIEAFWESVHLHMISRGFFDDPSQNPFVVQASYENWAPWIGRETRKGSHVLNTEYEKVPLQTSNEAPPCDVTQDRLVDELLKRKVSTIRKLCKSCNVETRGSRIDLINRLRDEMKSRQTYDKVLQSVGGSSGGWSVIMCPHGIVYSVKFNLRAESPRDFTDLLLSWKHFPNVCVYDFAHGLAAHANLRVPDKPPFQPHEGRLADPTKDNVDATVRQKFKVHLPWLVNRLQYPEANGHPVTGSNQHYVLYDKFQRSSNKDPRDVLRRVDVVPELQGSLNSQVMEQLFAALRKNNYFLNNMGPSSHVFLMRNIIEHRNNLLNEELQQRMQ